MEFNFQWRSYPALRQEQFVRFIVNAGAQVGQVDTIAERILLRRDVYEKLLLKNLIIQIALYVALVVTPADGSFLVFGAPFKAVREVMLFLLGLNQILAIFVASIIKLQNEFIAVWQALKFQNQLPAPINLAYASNLVTRSWYPMPPAPLQRTWLVAALSKLMELAPPIMLFAMVPIGFTVGTIICIDVWHHPSVPSVISKATILFYIFSYLLNLAYALADTIPLPYRS